MKEICTFYRKIEEKYKEILEKTCTVQKIVVPLHPQIRNNSYMQ